MLTIDPFNFSPAGPLDPLTAYFYCTWMRVSYYGVVSWRDTLKTLIGADDVLLFDPPVCHHTELVLMPGDRGIAIVRGTDSNTLLASLLTDRAQVSVNGLAGLVHRLISIVAADVFQAIQPSLPTVWTAAGHSLGGGVADIISSAGAIRVISAGSPRVGNSTYATSRNSNIYLRLTNSEDIVPKSPPSAVDTVDHAILILNLGIPAFESFTHWGTRVNLFSDGTITRPPEIGTNREIALHLANLWRDGLGFSEHYLPEYLRRLRSLIPVDFPSATDPEFVGLDVLDQLNEELNANEGTPWIVEPRDSSTLHQLRRILNWRAIADSEFVHPPEVPYRCE